MQSQSDSGIMAQWWRLGGFVGIAWAIVFVITFAMAGEPPSRSDSVAEIREYFSDDGEMYLARDWLIAVSFFFLFLPYTVVLSYMVRRDGGTPPILATLIIIGAVSAVLVGLAASAFWGALAISADNPEIDDSVIRAIMELDAYAFALLQIPLGLFLAASSLAIWRTGVIWRWLALLGGLAAVLLVVGAAWPIDGDDEGAIAILGFIGFPGLLLFVLISSIGMAMRKTPPNATA